MLTIKATAPWFRGRYKAILVDAELPVIAFKKMFLGSLGRHDLVFLAFFQSTITNQQSYRTDKIYSPPKELVPDRHTIINAVCKAYETDGKEMARVRRGIQNEPRDVATCLLRTISGETLMGIGSEFGMNRYSSVSSAVTRIQKKRKKDRQFLERLNSVIDLAKKGQT